MRTFPNLNEASRYKRRNKRFSYLVSAAYSTYLPASIGGPSAAAAAAGPSCSRAPSPRGPPPPEVRVEVRHVAPQQLVQLRALRAHVSEVDVLAVDVLEAKGAEDPGVPAAGAAAAAGGGRGILALEDKQVEFS